MRASDPRSSARRSRRVGPLLLLLPLALLALGFLHLLKREPSSGPAPVPGVTSPDVTVSALTGELAGVRASSGWLVATLTPLHADARREAFESDALRRELGLAEGTPWRLSVRWDGPDASARGGSGTGVAPGSGDVSVRSEPAGIRLGAVTVEDDSGLALECLPTPAPPAAGDPIPPLRTLVAPPQGALRPGQTADWILWGRAPGDGARLLGLVPESDEAFTTATGFQGSFPLRATRVRRGDLGQPLARLDCGSGGKTGAAEASLGGDDAGPADDR